LVDANIVPPGDKIQVGDIILEDEDIVSPGEKFESGDILIRKKSK
jgi:hypothetical protein